MLRNKIFISFFLALLLIPVSITHAWISEVDGTLCWNGDVNFPIIRSYKFEGIPSNPDEDDVLKTFLVVDLNATKRNGSLYDVTVHSVNDSSQKITNTYHWLYRSNTGNPNTKSLYYVSKDNYLKYGNKYWVNALRNSDRLSDITNIMREQYEAYQYAAHKFMPDIPISFLPPRLASFEHQYYKKIVQNKSPYDDLQRRVDNAYWDSGFISRYGYSKYDYSYSNCYIDYQGYVRGLVLFHDYETGETKIDDLQVNVINIKTRRLGRYRLNANGKIERISNDSATSWTTPEGKTYQYCIFLRNELSLLGRK